MSGIGAAGRRGEETRWRTVNRVTPAAVGESAPLRPAWAEIDLGAIRANAELLARVAAPARLCAVVKAGGYGHGAVPVARAALSGGATYLAVALVEEGRQLRRAGITAPVLVLSEPPPAAMAEVVAWGLTPTIYTRAGLDALCAAAGEVPDGPAGEVPDGPAGEVPDGPAGEVPDGPAGEVPDGPAGQVSEGPASQVSNGLAVHVKVDTGMHRVGASPADAVALACEVSRHPELRLEGFWTHFAVADEIDDPYTSQQVATFRAAVDALADAGIRPPLLHAANSAGTLWHPRSRFDMVRCGIALYGLSPAGALAGRGDAALLRPALTLKARVSHVKRLHAGERLSYGLRYRLERESVIATIPLGYADGVTRQLASAGGQVLVGGCRLPLAGTVTMDQVLVDCGPDSEVAPGDEVVLLGRQGSAVIGAWEWAEQTGTIAYEVVCGVSERVPRIYSEPV